MVNRRLLFEVKAASPIFTPFRYALSAFFGMLDALLGNPFRLLNTTKLRIACSEAGIAFRL